jgi:hypothetical protein
MAKAMQLFLYIRSSNAFYFMNLKQILISALAIVFGACRHTQPSATEDFGPQTDADQLKQTVVVPTMANAVSDSNNVIYSPIFLLAWDNLKVVLGAPLTTSDGSVDTVNRAFSFRNALAKDEYSADVSVTNTSVSVRTKFENELKFPTDFKIGEDGLQFNYVRVNAFGMPFYDKDLAKQITVLYYGNDGVFIIRLVTKDEDKQLILACGCNRGRMDEVNARIDSLIIVGEAQARIKDNAWKYNFEDGETMLIPVMRFNIANEYTPLIGKGVTDANGHIYTISKAQQSTAFLLNENGAKVKARAEVELTMAEDVPEPGKQPRRKKHLVFDKPFTVIMRKQGQRHPYLMVKVENTELMVK